MKITPIQGEGHCKLSKVKSL